MLDSLCGDAVGCVPVVRLAQIFVCIFLGILFLQSGIDKIVDRKGNLEWLTGHFANSPLAGVVPLMVSVVTLTELLAGAFSALGAIALVAFGSKSLAIAGVSLSCLSLIMLFFGQRLAKDYEGAAVLTSYFGVTLVAMLLFSAG